MKTDRRAVLAGALAGAVVVTATVKGAWSANASLPVPAPGPLTPFLGKVDARRVMSVYFDYHCPYCRALEPHLQRLAERNQDLKILYRELPILRLDSQLAARIALSAQLRGRYFDAHARLMRITGDFTGAVATDIANWLHLDPVALRRDMGHPSVTAELRNNSTEADTLGVQATPAVVTRLELRQGMQTLKQLQEMVDALSV